MAQSCHAQLLSMGFEAIYSAPSRDEFNEYVMGPDSPLNVMSNYDFYQIWAGHLATQGEALVLDGYYILYRKKLN